ncbi:unnamed protein product [Linum trigynum]|uniref:Uncharacterized protein n=1 Tax=Linum trigynum TaxID=586398 RepID=A0AAV2G760_9ROSI
MNLSKFFDSEWIRLSQRLQQSLDRYEREARERAAAEGEMVEMAASTAAGETGWRRSAGLTEDTTMTGQAITAASTPTITAIAAPAITVVVEKESYSPSATAAAKLTTNPAGNS